MLSAETLAFLTDLKANNRRDWFEANRGAMRPPWPGLPGSSPPNWPTG